MSRLRVLVLGYLERFGTKLCCFDDLRPYLELFIAEGEERTALVEAIRRMGGERSGQSGTMPVIRAP
jgi:hypothetical protein